MEDTLWIAVGCLIAWNLWQRRTIRTMWMEISLLRWSLRDAQADIGSLQAREYSRSYRFANLEAIVADQAEHRWN